MTLLHSSPTRGTPRIFRGWSVVAALFVMLAVSAGLAFYGQALYLSVLVTERGFSVGLVSGATAVFFLVTGISGVAVAHLITRFDVRIVVIVSAMLLGSALLALGRADELWQVYAIYVLLGVGAAGTALVPATTTVTRWFRRRRTLALSITYTGISLGGIGLIPLVTALIGRRGMAGATPWLAAIAIGVVVPVALVWLRSSPESVGQAPDGDRAATAAQAAPANQLPVWGIVRSRPFIVITAAFALVMFAQLGAFAHHFNLVSGRAGEGAAALGVSLLAASSILGRALGVLLVGRIPTAKLALVLLMVQAGSLLMLGSGSGRLSLLAGSVLLGTTMGNLLMLHPLVLVDTFGDANTAKLFSASALFMTVGMAAGPATVGILHDLAGGYFAGFTFAASVSLVAAVVLRAAGTPSAGRS